MFSILLVVTRGHEIVFYILDSLRSGTNGACSTSPVRTFIRCYFTYPSHLTNCGCPVRYSPCSLDLVKPTFTCHLDSAVPLPSFFPMCLSVRPWLFPSCWRTAVVPVALSAIDAFTLFLPGGKKNVYFACTFPGCRILGWQWLSASALKVKFLLSSCLMPLVPRMIASARL